MQEYFCNFGKIFVKEDTVGGNGRGSKVFAEKHRVASAKNVPSEDAALLAADVAKFEFVGEGIWLPPCGKGSAGPVPSVWYRPFH
jgi:hypothetical protein